MLSGMNEAEFVDTSVVVRYLTGMPTNQADHAAEMIDETDGLLISAVSVAEARTAGARIIYSFDERFPGDGCISGLRNYLKTCRSTQPVIPAPNPSFPRRRESTSLGQRRGEIGETDWF